MSGSDLEALIDAGKRFIVMHGTGTEDGRPTRDAVIRGRMLLEALRRQAFLNARLFAPIGAGSLPAIVIFSPMACLTRH